MTAPLLSGCSEPLGLKDYTISDGQITASSTYKTWGVTSFSWYPFYARLDKQGKFNAWTAERNSASEWLQVGQAPRVGAGGAARSLTSSQPGLLLPRREFPKSLVFSLSSCQVPHLPPDSVIPRGMLSAASDGGRACVCVSVCRGEPRPVAGTG